MRPMTITLLVCAAVSGFAFLAAGEPKANRKAAASDRAQVIAFLKEHVIGKTVAMPKRTDPWEGNKMEVDYEDQMTFNSFAETATGFGFDVTTVMKMTSYDLDKAGKRALPGRDFSGTFVARYELCERASTKKITGIARGLSMTMKLPSQEGTVILVTGVKVADGKLSWNETVPGYVDVMAAKGTYKPASFDASYTFSVVEGKLRTVYDEVFFDVDPDTLKRTPTKEKIPPMVANELECK